MNKTKDKFKLALNKIISKDNDGARKLIKEAIQQNPKYITYKKQLSEMGLDYKEVLVEDKIYDDIKSILEKFDKNLQLKILDVCYKEISKGS